MAVDIGIDLGTASILVYVRERESYSKNLLSLHLTETAMK